MKYLAHTNSDLTAMHFIDSGIAGGTTSLMRRLGTFFKALLTVVLRMRTSELVHLNLASKGSTYRKLCFAVLLSRIRKPFVIHLHGGGYETFYRQSARLLRFAVRYMFTRASAVVVLGPKWAKFVVDDIGVTPRKVYALPNATPGPARAPSKSGPFEMLFVGRMSSAKGAAALLESIKSLPSDVPWRLRMLGDKPDNQVLDLLSRAPSNVEYLGWVEQDRIADFLAKTHLFILPSMAEGLPLALLEAMGQGAVPVVTPVGSIPDVVQEGRNGRLVSVDDPDGLSVVLAELLHDGKQVEHLSEAARQTWAEKYSIETYRAALDQIWMNALDKTEAMKP